MSEEETTAAPTGGFDGIPDRDPLPPDFEGPGISEDLDKIKTATLVNEQFGVMGFLILDSAFDDTAMQFPPVEGQPPPEKKKYALVEIMLQDGNRFVTSTSSNAILRALRKRHELGHIPFKTVLRTKTSKKTGNPYYLLEEPEG